MNRNKLPWVFLLALVLGIFTAGCAGNLQQIQVNSLKPAEKAQFMAHVDESAAAAGLHRQKSVKNEHLTYADATPMSLITTYRWKDGKDSGMWMTWEPQSDWVEVKFAEGETLETLAVGVARYAEKNYGKQRVFTWRPVPFVNWLLEDF